jgi:hypothetical protein
MKRLALPLVAALVLAACGKPSSTDATDTVESLMSDPSRLKELRAQCKADRAKVGETTCHAVDDAFNRRFLGTGTPYTPPTSPPATFSAPKH